MTRRTLAILVMVLYIALFMIEPSVSAASQSRSCMFWGGCAVAAMGMLTLMWMLRFRPELPQNFFSAFTGLAGLAVFVVLVMATGLGLMHTVRYCLDRWKIAAPSTDQWHAIRLLCMLAAMGSVYAVMWLSARWIKKQRHQHRKTASES